MAYQQISWIYGAGMVVRGLFLAAILVVCWIGWLRQKHPGYAVLIGWNLSTMLFLGFSYSLPIVLSRMLTPGGDQSVFLALFNTFGFILNSALLLLGLALLVFRKSPPDKTTSTIPAS